MLFRSKLLSDADLDALDAEVLEAIEAAGGNPFMDYSVPEAILKMRQGVGRLIRTATDRGVVAICDPRLAEARYREQILELLPPMRRRSLLTASTRQRSPLRSPNPSQVTRSDWRRATTR